VIEASLHDHNVCLGQLPAVGVEIDFAGICTRLPQPLNEPLVDVQSDVACDPLTQVTGV
jgi:hypothetical protein